MPTPAPLQNLNNEVKQSGSPTSPCSVSGERNQPTKKIQKNSQLVKKMIKAWQQLSEEALSSTRRVSEWLGKDTIRSASSQAACPSCLIPESDTLLPSPSALSLSLPLFCSVAHTGSLHRYSLTIVKWRTPPPAKRLSKFGFQEASTPTSLIVERHVWLCVCAHTTHVNSQLKHTVNFPP